MRIFKYCFPFIISCFSPSLIWAQKHEPRFVELPIDTRPIRFARAGINPDMREGIAYGLRAGVTASEFIGRGHFNDKSGNADFTHNKPFVGYVIGLLAEIPLTNQLYFKPEVDFTLTGNKVKASNYSQTIKLGYLNIPVLLVYKPIEGLGIFGGPQADYLLFAGYKSQYMLKSAAADVRSDFKSIGLSLLGGISYGITENLGVDLRYVRSLSNINNVNDGNKFKNSDIQFSLRYFY